MADSSVVSAFRQRALRRGYYNIHIKKDIFIFVTLQEPLTGVKLSFVCTENDLKEKLSRKNSRKT